MIVTKFIRIAPRFIVNDLKLALSFYTILGFEVDYNDGAFAIIKSDGVDLHINYDPESPPSHHVWWIEITEIDALYKRCQESSAKICSSVELQPWGFREFHIRDPFNNLLIFAEHQD